jgi:hypothetical protein
VSSLLDIQRRMAAAVMEPLTRDETMRKRRRDGINMSLDAPQFIKPGATLTSFERLEIYNRQYWFRLYDSFEDDFAGLKAVLGKRRFDRLMRAYIADRPFTSYTLRDLGSGLTDWLAQNESFTGSEFVLAQDVVRLEWAHIEAYDGADYPVPDPEFMASVTAETRIGLQPHVRLLALSYPADEFMVSLRQDDESSDISSNNASAERKVRPVRRGVQVSAEPVWLAVHHQDFTVYYKRLRLEEYQMLTALQSGMPLGEVFAAGFDGSSMNEDARPGFLQDCFQQWTTLRWLHNPAHIDPIASFRDIQ